MKIVKNIILAIIGVFLCIPAILLGPVAKLLPINSDRPWVDGLLINTLRAYKKYNTISWIRRIISICQKPSLTLEYLSLLVNKQSIYNSPVKSVVDVNYLYASHWVETSHKHHRDRVESYKLGKNVTSQFGPIILVGNQVHDGNHRLAAMKEAGVKHVEALIYANK